MPAVRQEQDRQFLGWIAPPAPTRARGRDKGIPVERRRKANEATALPRTRATPIRRALLYSMGRQATVPANGRPPPSTEIGCAAGQITARGRLRTSPLCPQGSPTV